VSFKVKEELCGGASPCANIYGQVKCKGVLDPSLEPTDGEFGWSLFLVARHTINEAFNGDMTTVDFPISIPLPAWSNGAASVKFDYFTVGLNLGIHASLIPPCMSYEIVKLELRDPIGAPFAVPGLGNAP
jgi:hypothetical protein